MYDFRVSKYKSAEINQAEIHSEPNRNNVKLKDILRSRNGIVDVFKCFIFVVLIADGDAFRILLFIICHLFTF